MQKILIVDDDTTLLDYLQEELSDVGFEVQTYDNGADAIVATAEQSYDLILLDMMMPGLDGIQVVRVLRKIAPKVPIIGLTGYVGRGYMSQAMGLGVSILTKPVEVSSLVKVINKTIGEMQNN
jgi:DNA-binding response OmpR family regulator